MSTCPEITKYLGFSMVLISIPGLYFNVSSFFHFVSIEKTSFYIMCISKTISNSLVLLVYLGYNGPCAIFCTILVSNNLNSLLNEAIAYGIYLMGPLTQVLISINRFLVVYYSASKSPGYSNRVTVAVLLIFWVLALYITVLYGFPENCRIRLTLEFLDWTADDCTNQFINLLAYRFTYFVVFLGVFCNLLNFLVIIKLLLLAMRSKTLSSESSKRRQKTTIRLFIQNCIQDWIYVVDMVNSVYVIARVSGIVPIFLTGLGTNLFVHATDGFVMYMFHHKWGTGRKTSMISVSPKLTRARL